LVSSAVELLVYTEGVGSSNLSPSTILSEIILSEKILSMLSPNGIIDKPYDDFSWQNGFPKYLAPIIEPLKKRTAVDIGANYGKASLFFAEHFSKVVSFEVRKDLEECLRKNTTRHNNNVEVHMVGLGAKEETVLLLKEDRLLASGNYSTGLSRIVDNRVPFKKHSDGDIKTLDSFNLKDVDLIKIDVEGYELNVLKGAKQTIKEFKPLLIVEVRSDRNPETVAPRKELFSLIKELGYHLLDARTNDFIFECK
jgi:FkbM family methyltransferase